MSQTIKRLTIAGLISATSFAVTFTWYYLTKPEDQLQNLQGEKVAEIISAGSEVNKRPQTRLIWKALSSGDTLYNGETLKTSATSEAKIRFVNSESYLNIESNSLIVLEKSEGEVSLDLLEGGLFVKVSSTTTTTTKKTLAITLKSDKGNVKLSDAQVSVSKTKGENLDLQVLSGKAKVEVNGKTQVVEQGKKTSLDGKTAKTSKALFQVISPKPFSKLYRNPDRLRKVGFRFKPILKDYQVRLKMGSQRDQLNLVDNTQSKGTSGHIKAEVPIGKHYWQLIAVDRDEKVISKSSVFHFSIEAQTPPIPISPALNQEFEIDQFPSEIPFQWSGQTEYSNYRLQISRSKRFSKKTPGTQTTAKNASLKIEKPGRYFWRVVGFRNKRPSISPVFEFLASRNSVIRPPELTFPEHLSEWKKQEFQNKPLELKWEKTKAAQSYEIHLKWLSASQKAKSKKYQSKKPSLKIPRPPQGEFEWKVFAIGQSGIRSLASETFQFNIEGYPELRWLNESARIEYDSLQPQALFRWSQGPEGTQKYRLRIGPKKSELRKQTGSLLTKLEHVQVVPQAGNYYAYVESLDSSGRPLNRTPVKKFQIVEKALLQAPVIEPEKTKGQPLKANRSGKLKVLWSSVEGAEKYQMSLKSKTGEKTMDFSEDQAELSALLPGEYQITVRSVDKAGRRGPASVPRKIIVPNRSNLKAPTLKNFEVK